MRKKDHQSNKRPNAEIGDATMTYEEATVLSILCYQTNTSTVIDALLFLNDSATAPSWSQVADAVNWFKNEVNNHSKFWRKPYRADFSVDELKQLAGVNAATKLTDIENLLAKVEGEI